MNKYEIMFIIRPDLDEEGSKKVVENLKKALTSNGSKVITEKAMGQKELAYEIKKYKTGFYFLLNIEAKDSKGINEFDRLSLISEDVIRHLIIKEED